MKVLVTGGNGQLGREFRKLGKDHYFFTTRESLDICDFEEVSRLFAKERFDVLVNCAAYTAVDKAETEKEECFKVNVAAVQNLCLVAKNHNCQMIHISSDYVYHPNHELPISEEDLCEPKGVYAASKLSGEKFVLESTNNIVIRTSWVYSSFGHNFVKTMLRLAVSRSELSIVSDQIGSPTYAGDLAEAIDAIIGGPQKSGIYNYSNLGFTSWADFADAIFGYKNLPVKINKIPTSDYPTPARRPLNSRLIKSKIATDFGLELHHWKKSLQKCLEEIDN